MTERPPFVPGHFPKMPAADYHAVEALSSTGAGKLRQSCAHYKLFRESTKAPSDAQQLGTAIHAGVLEPDTFDAMVKVLPDVDKRTKAGREQVADFMLAMADAPDAVALSPADYSRALRSIEAVRAHPAARRLLDGAQVEQSLFWVDGQYGVPCKARIDIRSRGGMVDLKSTSDASPEGFARSVAAYQYHAQMAHYASGCEHVLGGSPDFVAFIAVETDPPHCVGVYALPGNAIAAGGALTALALERYKLMLDTGTAPGYPDTIETLRLPKWALRFDL